MKKIGKMKTSIECIKKCTEGREGSECMPIKCHVICVRDLRYFHPQVHKVKWLPDPSRASRTVREESPSYFEVLKLFEFSIYQPHNI